MHVAICDDDLIFIKDLKEKIIAYSIRHNKEIFISEFTTLDDAAFPHDNFDVIFLDIRFQGQNLGIEWAKQLRMAGDNTLIVICSSLHNQIIHGYEAEPIRFLLKPVSASDLSSVLDACYLKLNFQGKKIIIRSNFNDVFIQISKIFYIESISRQRNIVLSTGQAVPTYEPLQKLYAKLNSDRFQFTHKCYVVQLSKVDRIEQNFVFLTNGKQIPLARNLSAGFKKSMIRFMEGRA